MSKKKTLKAAENLLRAYSTWIGKTSNERELINAIKLALELMRKAIKED